MIWHIVFAKQAQKDARNLAPAGLKEKAQLLLAVLAKNPFQTPPPYEKLVGDLAAAYSRRINIQHRLGYQVLQDEKTVGTAYVVALRVAASVAQRTHVAV